MRSPKAEIRTSSYLRSGSFSLSVASGIASDLLESLVAHVSGEPEVFYAIARRIESNGAKLPANVKQLANQWIVTRGSSANTIP